jgi:hypothetical protein
VSNRGFAGAAAVIEDGLSLRHGEGDVQPPRRASRPGAHEPGPLERHSGMASVTETRSQQPVRSRQVLVVQHSTGIQRSGFPR